MAASHTLGPLSVSTLSGSHGWINGPDGSPLATVYPAVRTETREVDGATFTRTWHTRSDDEVRATAERIVRAYNCHDDVLAALQRMLDCHQAAMDAAQSSAAKWQYQPCACGACDEARAALAKAAGNPIESPVDQEKQPS